MINSIDQDYADAKARGDTQAMAYLRVIMGGIANDPVAMNSVGMSQQSAGIPQIQLSQSNDTSILAHSLATLKSIVTNPFGNLGATADAMVGNFAPGQALNQSNQDTATALDSAGSALTSGFDFITDIPRVATTIIGGLMIAAGLFSLAGGSHTQIIELVKKSP